MSVPGFLSLSCGQPDAKLPQWMPTLHVYTNFKEVFVNTHVDRREFLKLSGVAAAATVAVLSMPRFSWSGVKAVSLEQCLGMSAQEMATQSKLVDESMKYIRKVAASIGDAKIKGIVTGILDNPAPTFTAALQDEQNRKAVHAELKAAGFVEGEVPSLLPPVVDPSRSPQSFDSAPGSGYASHHAYPGGLATHTALNLQSSLAIYEGYKDVYGLELDRDTVITSQILHDLHKPWVFQWGADGSSRTEQKLAGTGEHHPLSVAESLYRGLPVEICIAQACAHNHPGTEKDETEVIPWLKAAAILNGIDPIKKGLLDTLGKSLPLPRRMEGFVCHLGDHDYVLSVPAAKWLVPVMKEIAAQYYGLKGDDAKTVAHFNAFRNYVFSQTSIMNLYGVFSAKGKDALANKVREIVTV